MARIAESKNVLGSITLDAVHKTQHNVEKVSEHLQIVATGQNDRYCTFELEIYVRHTTREILTVS